MTTINISHRLFAAAVGSRPQPENRPVSREKPGLPVTVGSITLGLEVLQAGRELPTHSIRPLTAWVAPMRS